jgi:hypothetical protein
MHVVSINNVLKDWGTAGLILAKIRTNAANVDALQVSILAHTTPANMDAYTAMQIIARIP